MMLNDTVSALERYTVEASGIITTSPAPGTKLVSV